jgi:hypothetical protein
MGYHDYPNLTGTLFFGESLTAVVGQLLAVTAGTTLAKGLLGWIPILGNVANAGVAFGVTEAIGWAAYLVFEEGGDISKVTAEEWKELIIRQKKIKKPVVTEILVQMTPEDQARYKILQDKLKDKNLTDHEKEEILLEMAQIPKT